MSIKDTSKQDLRSLLLSSGNIKPATGIFANTIKHIDPTESRAAAIAARRNELCRRVETTTKKRSYLL